MARKPRTAADAIAWGNAWVKSTHPAPTTSGDWLAWCLVFVRSCFNVDAHHRSAIEAWRGARRRHPVSRGSHVPTGVPVFWSTGTWGHVALSIGGGYCLSNDILRPGRIDVVKIDTITRRWGAKLLGWTEDLNGVTVASPRANPAQPKPVQRVSPTLRRLMDEELSLIEKLNRLERGTPEFERRELQLARVYQAARTFDSAAFAALRREYVATKAKLERTAPGKRLAIEREVRKTTRLDMAVRRGLPS